MFNPGDKVMIADPFCTQVYEIDRLFYFTSKRSGVNIGDTSIQYALFTNGNYCDVELLVEADRYQKFMESVVKSCMNIKPTIQQIQSDVKTPGLTKSQIVDVLKSSDKPLTVYEIQERLPLKCDLEIHAIYTSCWRMVDEGKLVKTKTMGHFIAFYSVSKN